MLGIGMLGKLGKSKSINGIDKEGGFNDGKPGIGIDGIDKEGKLGKSISINGSDRFGSLIEGRPGIEIDGIPGKSKLQLTLRIPLQATEAR